MPDGRPGTARAHRGPSRSQRPEVGSDALQNSPACQREGMLPTRAAEPSLAPPPSPTFSLWMSLLIWEILIFMASSSSSSTRGMLGVASESSTVWKLRSVSGMYHLQSYCWVLLGGGRGRLTG